jgi:tRNA modification GTPase
MFIQDLDDTIAAISTPLGQGGIGLVRVSGQKAFAIADALFVSPSSFEPSSFKTHSVHYGRIVSHKEGREDIVDEVLLTVMKAPKSYTCEDMAEISCHGGFVAVRKILELVLQHGARLAQPGEFTKRAFLNGRIDLTQAEAVLDIIQAKTESFLKVSVQQLKGDLVLELKAIREALMDVYTELEAIVNFPEDDIEASQGLLLSQKIDQARQRIERLLESRYQGKILKDGMRIVICGKPNVGKSSLLNTLLKQPRAIVSPLAGTTRDTIEEWTQINDFPVQLIDTAGILEPRDEIEKEAVRRSHVNIEEADLILFMLDGSSSLDVKDYSIAKSLKNKRVILVFNKCDCGLQANKEQMRTFFPDTEQIEISALYQQNIEELKNKMIEHVLQGHHVDSGSLIVSNARQIESLQNGLSALIKTQKYFLEKLSLEFIAEEIKIAIDHLDQITGKNVNQDLLEKIFSSFCIGK